MTMRRFALAAIALLLVAGSAAAVPAPVIYYLKDGPVRGVGDGALSVELPPGLYLPPTDPIGDPQGTLNVTNNQPPGIRLVVPLVHNLAPVQFVGGKDNNTGRIYGPILVAVWAPKTALVQNANLTVSLVDTDGSPGLPGGTVLASSSVAIDAGDTVLPNVTALIPPDPTNVTGTIAYLQGQILSFALQQAIQPPLIYLLDDDVKDYLVDAEVNPEHNLALRFQLDPGSSPLGPLGLPVAVAQTIEFDFALAPSLVYIPWYAADPPKPTPPTPVTKPTPSPTMTHSTPTPTPTPSPTPKKEKSPGLELPVLLGSIAWLGYAMRRTRKD